MNLQDYFRSLSQELHSLRDRVRHLISGNHWPTDGEWKESILRTVIRRNAPQSVTVGRGFVVCNEFSSPQLDILVYDNSYPVLYRDGDLVFVSPDACRAIIEVKTRVNPRSLKEAALKLADAVEKIRLQSGGRALFAGLFAYQIDGEDVEQYLEQVCVAARGSDRRVIDHVCLGASTFIKYWSLTPTPPWREYKRWHCYDVKEMSAGYFIHNLLMHLAPQVHDIDTENWFPRNGKEQFGVCHRGLIED